MVVRVLFLEDFDSKRYITSALPSMHACKIPERVLFDHGTDGQEDSVSDGQL